MGRKKKKKANRLVPLVQYALFAILVVMTPFIVVTRYLQGAVHLFSHLSFQLFGINIPFVLSFAVVSLVALWILFRKSLTRRKLMGLLFILGMVILGHETQDLYANLSFFDLQQNWHYVAYGAYVFYFFRAFHNRGMSTQKIIFLSFFSAVALSTFDESFQFFMSHRIFDISDITKDAWGCIVGLVLMLFVVEEYGTIHFTRNGMWKPNLSEYLHDPQTAFILVFILGLSFIFISPLLTNHEYGFLLVTLALILFLVLFLVYHGLQFKLFRILAGSLFALVLFILAGLAVFNGDAGCRFYSWGLSTYRGVPVPFFDYLVYPNGVFRLVDKKHFFNELDKKFLLDCEEDILIVASGSQGKGGKGFPVELGTTFLFDENRFQGVQVIILPTPDAMEVYNRLRAEEKKVLLVIHNTC